MIVLGIDPGETAGLGLVIDGVPTWAMEARGFERLQNALRDLVRNGMKPDRIVIEKPTKPAASALDSYGELRERAGEAVALCRTFFSEVPILRPWPIKRTPTGKRAQEPGWQDVRAGSVGAGKDASLDTVKRAGASAEVLRACATPGLNAADAVCMALWGAGR